MMEPVIKVENISKSYIIKHQKQKGSLKQAITDKIKSGKHKSSGSMYSEEFWALKDINFEIQQGDRLGIIGKNGAGKSTLLKILSRITEPTTGRIVINGRIASLLEVGTGFHPELTGRENVFLNGSILGMSKAEIKKHFDEIVDFSGVEQFLDTPVKRYSSGMYVRLAFAVAAHLEPEILIIDEVLAVGDADFQKKCLGKMQDVSTNQGRTVIFVSHSMQTVQKLCNKGILLQKGQLLDFGPTNQIIDKYLGSVNVDQAVFEIPQPVNVSEVPGYAYKVQVEDLQGNLLPEIPIGKPWQVRILVRLVRSTPHFIIGLGVVTAMDLPLRTSWTAPADLAAGDYEAVFKHDDIMLTTGKYSLVVGLSTEKKAFHYIDNIVKVQVSEITSITNEKERIVNYDSGLIINPMQVQLNPL